MVKLTAIVLTSNEEKNLPQCLETLQFADEILVIDDWSTDKTVEIAKKFGAEVYRRKLNDFASQRNFALSKATGKWVLFVDADERVTEELREEILTKIQNQVNGYQIPRKNKIFGKFFRFTDWYPDHQLHLFKRLKGKYQRQVHERVVVEGKVGKLKNPLIHNNYQTIDQFIFKNFFRYADLEARVLVEEGYRFQWVDLFKKPVGEFLRRFFACQGYKDGIHGLVASALVSLATFVIYAKVWEREGFQEKNLTLRELNLTLKKAIREIKYWLKETRLRKEKNFLKRAFLKLWPN